ncbi:MAG: DNA-3-methyladenine glycosylase [Acidobacteria bacterium]|nr:MAG: DNA-3-methyladenine glycosylase [Acidobacteriota bacterium]
MRNDRWRPPTPLAESFFRRPAEVVAPDLLGKVLWRHSGDAVAAVKIVETEAYGGADDPGSHGFRGMTKRNAVMFGEPGRTYIYFTYGMHYCLNVVTDEPGVCSAVLIRAGEPICGKTTMAERRNRDRELDLTSGPAKLAQALDLTTDENAMLLSGEVIGIGDDGSSSVPMISCGPRVGIREGLELNWRFAVSGNPFVSRPAPRCSFG